MMSLGAKGVISVLSNVAPKETHDIVALYNEGKVKESCDLQLKALPLIHALFSEVNPIPVKKALNLMGKEVGTASRTALRDGRGTCSKTGRRDEKVRHQTGRIMDNARVTM